MLPNKRQKTSDSSILQTVGQDKTIIETLPCEILIHIFTFLDGASLISCCGVCSSWNRIILDQDTLLFKKCYEKIAGPSKKHDSLHSWKLRFLSASSDSFLCLISEYIHNLDTKQISELPSKLQQLNPTLSKQQQNVLDFLNVTIPLTGQNKEFQLEVLKSARMLYLEAPDDFTTNSNYMDEDEPLDDPNNLYKFALSYYADGNHYMSAVYLRKAADKGRSSAQSDLGRFYKRGQGVEPNITESVKWFTMSAKSGDADGQFHLGMCYMEGIGVEKNSKEGVKWLKIAAENGDSSAQAFYALCLMIGEGVERNYEEAMRWSLLSAEQDDPSGQTNLGMCYMAGRGVEKNHQEAVKWFTLAANIGHPAAQFELGKCYKRGLGVEKNEEEAIKWFKLSADFGHPAAWVELALHDIRVGDANQMERAVNWLINASQKGNKVAQSALSECYMKGSGVQQNYVEAVRWALSAAEKGDATAQMILAKCYMYGYGVPKDSSEALKWLAKATEKWHYADQLREKNITREQILQLMSLDDFDFEL